MLSRRSVRIKVMQLLFALSRDEKLTFNDLKNRYSDMVDETFNLLFFTLSAIVQITSHAVQDKEKRQSKHLPSDEDKNFSDKFYQNEIIQAIANSSLLKKKAKKHDFETKISKDFSRKVYSDFSKTDLYKAYVYAESNTDSHREILLEAFRYCRKDEYFNEVMEDHFPCWVDDKSLIVGAIKKIVKAFPDVGEEFFDSLAPDEETIDDFGAALLENSHKKDDELLQIIEPVLKNWDSDRIAVIDMILMKLAVTEMISFTTIPTKVTLNEYVEVAKLYSTAKSKDFINGILDKLMKDLDSAGKIVKEGRGLDE